MQNVDKYCNKLPEAKILGETRVAKLISKLKEATESFTDKYKTVLESGADDARIREYCNTLPEAKILGETRVDKLIEEINSKKS